MTVNNWSLERDYLLYCWFVLLLYSEQQVTQLFVHVYQRRCNRACNSLKKTDTGR